MAPEFWFGLAVFILLAALAIISQRRHSKVMDWDLYMAFVRHDFPPEQRETAQGLAGQLGRLVGPEIKNLRPEHTLREIAEWSNDSVSTLESAMAWGKEFGVDADPDITFREFVERISANDKEARPMNSATG